ncbi:unnamed protein product [Spodoptera exigua]|nr:unnamed protein product [Spodoptera exigua]
MLLSQPQQEDLLPAGYARNGLVDENKRWPNRTVVYHINEEDFDDTQTRGNHDNPDMGVTMTFKGSEGGCASTVGYNPDNGIPQYVKLADNCFGHGTLIHEIMHTLGFSHMQSTYDRDDYVDIVWENIIPGHEANFVKHSNESVSDFGVPYDYHSVMHYPDTAFTANGSQTVIPLKDNVTIGQREGLSHGDILKLNRMYCEEAADEDKSVVDK